MSLALAEAGAGVGAHRLAVVLDNLTGAGASLAWGSVLARELGRELLAVYVESTSALAAAALPVTQALAHGAAAWVRYDTADMARAHRAQAARLSEQLRRASAQHHICSSLQVVRGTLAHAAIEVDERADLVLLGAQALSSNGKRPLPCRTVLVWVDGGERALPVRGIAQVCAQSLGAVIRTLRSEADVAAAMQAVSGLVVMPRALASPVLLGRARSAVLLVGSKT